MSIQCPQCNTVNPQGARFCSGCGVQFTGAAPVIRKNSLSTPVIVLIVVIALCGLCGLCGRSARDRNQSAGVPIPTPANANTYTPSTFVSTDSANKIVNANVTPPVARKKRIPKKPPAIVNTTESVADGEDGADGSDTNSISGTDSSVYTAPAQRSVSAPRANNGYYTGPRGGCYTYSASGKKRYVDHSYCN